MVTINKPATRAASMDFNGTWKVYHQENLENFLRAIGVPEIVIKMRKDVKPVVMIEQNSADFTFTIKTPHQTQSQSFSVGKESELTGVDGRKIKCLIRQENGKLITESDKFTSVREIEGDEMIETVTTGSETFICRSKRV